MRLKYYNIRDPIRRNENTTKCPWKRRADI